MQTLFGLLVVCGPAASGFNHCDLLTAGSSVIISGVAPSVLLRVCLRCLLSFCLRMCGFVGLVLIVAGVDCSCPPSVASPTASERGNLPPFIMYHLDCLFQLFYCRLCGFVFQILDALNPLLCYLLVVLLLGQRWKLAILWKKIVLR